MKIAVVIPCFKVRNHVLQVLNEIPDNVDLIVCVDDACPDQSGDFIKDNSDDTRIVIKKHNINQGVGAATLTGFQTAKKMGMDICVKIDGDGQMDPKLLDKFVSPILTGRADYTKGNRFWDIEYLKEMPKLRIIGNISLSFMNKFSSGYWQIMDPSNGYIAIHLSILEILNPTVIEKRFLFETELMFRLSLVRAVVHDIPMKAVYGTEVSNLKISKVLVPFLWQHGRNYCLRIFYNYILRDFNAMSLGIIIGIFLLFFGFFEGINLYYRSNVEGIAATSGQVMLAALPIIIAIQLLISAINYDISNTPKNPIHNYINQ